MRLASPRGLSLGSLPASSQEVRCERETDFSCLKPLRFEGFVTATKPPCLIHHDCQAPSSLPKCDPPGPSRAAVSCEEGVTPGRVLTGLEVFHLEPHSSPQLLAVCSHRSLIHSFIWQVSLEHPFRGPGEPAGCGELGVALQIGRAWAPRRGSEVGDSKRARGGADGQTWAREGAVFRQWVPLEQRPRVVETWAVGSGQQTQGQGRARLEGDAGLWPSAPS